MVADRSGEILGGALAGAGRSVGDFMKQRAEENKQHKLNYDVVKFLAAKKPELFGEGFDISSISPQQATGVLNGAMQLLEIGQKQSYAKQVELSAKRLEQEIAQAERQGILTPVEGMNNVWSAGGKFYTVDPESNSLINIEAIPSMVRERRLEGRGIGNFGVVSQAQGQEGPPVPQPPPTPEEVLQIKQNIGQMTAMPQTPVEQAGSAVENLLMRPTRNIGNQLFDDAGNRRGMIPFIGDAVLGTEMIYDYATGGKRKMATNSKEEKKRADRQTSQMTPSQLALLKQLLEAGGRTVPGGSQSQPAAQTQSGIKSVKQIQ